LIDYRPVYLDTSALLKLVVAEAESGALMEWLHDWPDQLTSTLARVETIRRLRRKPASKAVLARAEAVLAAVNAIHLDGPVLSTAVALKDPLLRSLDAIHLACALSIGDAPEAFVTYDARLASAARRLKITVVAPGTRTAATAI
jgi:predicted nucleic acid-binding protein